MPGEKRKRNREKCGKNGRKAEKKREDRKETKEERKKSGRKAEKKRKKSGNIRPLSPQKRSRRKRKSHGGNAV